jgi:uncharacterized phage protein (TIGR01671 family)
MRWIKFRAVNKEDGDWEEGHIVQVPDSENDLMFPTYCVIHNDNTDEVTLSSPIRVVAKSVGQYTDIYTNDGFEVCENDIVEYYDMFLNTKSSTTMGIVEYENGSFVIRALYGYFHEGTNNRRWCAGENGSRGFTFPLNKEKASRMKIIGDSYSNPELLSPYSGVNKMKNIVV